MGSGTNTASPSEPVTGGRGLLRTRDFVLPYLAETQSIAGDQIGRVALSVLVFDRTGSVAWTALTYALTYLPSILGGFVLGGAGDRFPRVWVMVLADLLRAALFLVVAIRGLPLPVVVAAVAVAFFLGPAFTAAMVSRLSVVLVPERFRAASGVRMITAQVAQVAGFALGGVIVAVVDPRPALVINAATFALSAVIVGLGLRTEPSSAPRVVPGGAAEPAAHTGQRRPAPRPRPAPEPGADTQVPRLLGDPWLRHLMLLTALAAFFVVPEGLAVPLAHDLGASTTVAGLLLAAGPLGSAVGAALLVRFVPQRQGMTVARAMAVACGVPLVATAFLPPWPVVVVCWAMTGGLWAYQVDVTIAFVQAVDERARSRAVARASAVLLGAQGLGLLAFGAVGGALGARWGVATAGIVGVVAASALSWRARRYDADPRNASTPQRNERGATSC